MHLSKPRNLLLLAAALVASLALVACGGDDDSSESSDSPEAAVEGFLTAIADGDGAAACGYASASALETIEGGSGSCEEQITAAFDSITDEDREQLENATFETTEETEETATVTVSNDGAEEESFNLVLEDGEWKIES